MSAFSEEHKEKQKSSLEEKKTKKVEEDPWDEPKEIHTYSGLDPRDEFAEVQKLKGTIYQAARSFEELKLSKDLQNGIYEMKFTKPSKIQADALPIILAKENLIAQAQHGSGKTAAYGLGVLSSIDVSKSHVQALILVPTRELARQVHEVLTKIAKFTKIVFALAIPPTDADRVSQRDKSHLKGHVVVGTPGTALAKIRSRSLDVRSVHLFVLDEADEMVTMEMGLENIVAQVKKALPEKIQVLLFSATFPPKVQTLSRAICPKAAMICIKREQLTLEGIKQYYVDAGSRMKKFDLLMQLYGLLTIGQSIIFVHTRETAKSLCSNLRTKGYNVSLLHGADMSPADRDKVMDDFKTGRTTVLVSTNVLSRGIDVLQVTLVVNYDLPVTRENKPDPTTYIHRIGRSGRFGRKGVAINFVHDTGSKLHLAQIEEYFGSTITELPCTDVEKLERFLRKTLNKDKEV